MPSPKVEKSQPWKAHWPMKTSQPVAEEVHTDHGFAKGEIVVMDGNTTRGPHVAKERKADASAM